MTISLNGYTVEIKAKYGAVREKMNKRDTMAVLNLLSSWAFEAAENLERHGCHHIGGHARTAARDIYDLLDSKNYYEDVKKYD